MAGYAGFSEYPVDLTVEYQEEVNRFLWLIKWLLLLPHFIVLWFLSLPTIITTPLSWLAVVILGHYPTLLWEYHSGLLRWGWRVSYYSYEAGNTDQYPPFSFHSREDYPADLVVEYSETSSRLTGLFRWLLIIPHWIITAILSEIVGILVLFALIMVLFAGRYPKALFDIIMGMNIWIYRVQAYGWLLVDEYPPFRFE